MYEDTKPPHCILSVQSLSRVQLFATPWTAARQASLSITNSRSSLRLTSIELVMPSSHLILSSPSPPAPNPSQHQSLFQWVNSSQEVAKYWSFSFGIIPSKEIPGLISFRMDWFNLLAVQGTLKGLLQHHSSKASILRCSAFFIVQLSHPYTTTGKTIALTRWTFVGEVMCLLFNMLSRLVITFLPRSKRLLISWLQSPSAVILKPKKIKSDTVSTVSPSISHEEMGPDAMILVFWMLSFKYIQKLVDDTSSWEKENRWVSSSTPLSRNKENVEIKRTFYPDVQHACMLVARHLTPWTVAHQAPLSMGFSRQEYWSGWSYPHPGDLPHPGIEPTSLIFHALAGVFVTITTTR